MKLEKIMKRERELNHKFQELEKRIDAMVEGESVSQYADEYSKLVREYLYLVRKYKEAMQEV